MWENSLDWCVVCPGADHVRMNALKALVDLFWEPYFKAIAIQLGYNSPAALAVAKSCSDLHKADMMVALMMESGAQTLARHFVDEYDGERNETNFLVFLNETKNPNVQLLRDLG